MIGTNSPIKNLDGDDSTERPCDHDSVYSNQDINIVDLHEKLNDFPLIESLTL